MEKNGRNKCESYGKTDWMMDNGKRVSLERILKETTRQEKIQDIILPKLGAKQMSIEVMANLAGFSRATGYKIIREEIQPGQDTLLRIAFVLELNQFESQRLLKAGHCAQLTSGRKRDAVILYGLCNKVSLWKMDEMLLKEGFSPLIRNNR